MIKKIIYTVFIFLLLSSCSSKAEYDPDTLPSDIEVIKISGGYSIIPLCYEMKDGLIFYPGGLVEEKAYIPLASKIAKEMDIAVFITSMPFDLAVLNENAGDKILKKYNYINNWYIAGHSLGGVMAASYIYKHSDIFTGLILLASYPMDKYPLTNLQLNVISIIGSEDGLVENKKILNSKDLLPQLSLFAEIQGGNHAQFGSYGEQKGDNSALITIEEQQDITVKLIKDFFK